MSTAPHLAREVAESFGSDPEHYDRARARYPEAMVDAIPEKAADGMKHIGDPERWRFDWEAVHSRDEWLDQLPTHGGHSHIPPDQLAAIVAGVGDAIDAAGGSFTMRYATVVITAAR